LNAGIESIRAGTHVLVDTNVIIEAHRTNCWNAIVGHLKIDTVLTCVRECERGNQRRRDYIPVDTEAIIRTIDPKKVDDIQMAKFVLTYPGSADLDPGEKALLAYAASLPETDFLICSPDRACLNAIYDLGLIERYVSLELLARSAGMHPSLESHFTQRWLEERRTEVAFRNL